MIAIMGAVYEHKNEDYECTPHFFNFISAFMLSILSCIAFQVFIEKLFPQPQRLFMFSLIHIHFPLTLLIFAFSSREALFLSVWIRRPSCVIVISLFKSLHSSISTFFPAHPPLTILQVISCILFSSHFLSVAVSNRIIVW